MTDYAALAKRIRNWHQGRGYDWSVIAAAQLAADSQTLLWKIPGFVDPDGWIEWRCLAEHVDRSGWSSGEKALVRLACSLAGYTPKDADVRLWTLATMTTPLDQANSRLVVEAVRYAALGPVRVDGAR